MSSSAGRGRAASCQSIKARIASSRGVERRRLGGGAGAAPGSPAAEAGSLADELRSRHPWTGIPPCSYERDAEGAAFPLGPHEGEGSALRPPQERPVDLERLLHPEPQPVGREGGGAQLGLELGP